MSLWIPIKQLYIVASAFKVVEPMRTMKKLRLGAEFNVVV